MGKLLGGQQAPAGLTLVTECPPFPQGGAEAISQIAGAADATLVLKRARGQADGILHVTGRDVNEAEYALQFQDASGAWHLLDGPVSDHTVGDTRAAILKHVRAHRGAKPKDIATALPHVDIETIRRTCSRMAADGQLTRDAGGRYFPDTGTRTETTQEVSGLSGCPVNPSDLGERPGQSEMELSGLSGSAEADKEA